MGVDGIVGRVDGLMQDVSSQSKTITALRAELAVAKASSLAGEVRTGMLMHALSLSFYSSRNRRVAPPLSTH